MNLIDYLDGMRAARTASELDAAIRAPFKHSFRGRTWAAICKVRMERALAIIGEHAHQHFVPRIDGRTLTVCGETHRIGKGMNSTGVRYAWHGAGQFAKDALRRNGFSQRAACRIWSEASGDYPHRCLAIIEDALAGLLADPPMNKLIFSHMGTGPIKLTAAANDSDELDRRASRPCGCGGTRFDWGAGASDDFTFINWHCNKCRRIYIEYVSSERLWELRQAARQTGALGDRKGAGAVSCAERGWNRPVRSGA